MKISSAGWYFSLLTDVRLGVHQSNSWSTFLVTLPSADSQSSKRICILIVCGALPLYSGSPPDLSFRFPVGACQFALLLTVYSLGLNLNSRPPAPRAS